MGGGGGGGGGASFPPKVALGFFILYFKDNYEKQLPKVIPAVTDLVCISWNLLSHGIIMEKFLKPRKRQTSCDQDKNPEEPPKKRPSTCSCDQDRDPEESISKTTRLQSEPH